MTNYFKLILCLITLFGKLRQGSGVLLDSVVPAVLRDPVKHNESETSLSIAQNVRLLAVMNLMQQEWQLYDDHWYKLFETELQWIPAENFCRQLGGHLVSIKDAAENNFVHTLRKKNNIWIGLNKVSDPRGVYEWSDGLPISYLNWDSTQPNEPHVHCVYMAFNQDQRGTWFDYACHQKLPQFFVCKLKF